MWGINGQFHYGETPLVRYNKAYYQGIILFNIVISDLEMGTSSIAAKWADEVPLFSQGCVRLWGLIWVPGLLKSPVGPPPPAGQNTGLRTSLKAVFAYTAFTSLQLLCCIFPTLIWSTAGLQTNAPLKITDITYEAQSSLQGSHQAQPMLHSLSTMRISTCTNTGLFAESFASNSIKLPLHF